MHSNRSFIGEMLQYPPVCIEYLGFRHETDILAFLDYRKIPGAGILKFLHHRRPRLRIPEK